MIRTIIEGKITIHKVFFFRVSLSRRYSEEYH